MTELLVLEMVDKGLVTDQMVLTVGYDIENLLNPEIKRKYHGLITTDLYGRQTPKHAHGTTNLICQTSSTKLAIDAIMELYTKIVDKNLLVRRINITANHVVNEKTIERVKSYEQLDLFTDYEAKQEEREKENASLLREKQMQRAILDIKKKYGKNAILKGTNLEEGAMTMKRNKQIGGHKA